MTQTTDTETLAAPVPHCKVTFEEFLACADEDTSAEWVDGEIIPMSPVTETHQDLGKFLLLLISVFVEEHQLGKVFYERFKMKTGPNLPGREPDILFVAQAHLARVKTTFVDGPADLVLEIISPESGGRDRGDKYYEYEEGGVQEYWLLDPERKRAEFYQLGADGKYNLVTPEDGIYRSAVLNGLWLKVDWLRQNPLPPLLDVLKQWNII